tara:strand:+ start:2560 stop:2781 length:222 start_codon:yes stop_codon:yes gene_type:complete
MSRQDLKDFIEAAEHRITIRQELQKAKGVIEIIEIASSYGFKITEKDFQEDNFLQQSEIWFEKSKIHPLRKFS